VVEQSCAYIDLDGKEPLAPHLKGYQKNKLIAYSRIFAPGAIEKK
jgi:ElaA protein